MKLKLLFYSFFIILFLVLQTTLLEYAAIYGIKPNLIIVFVIVAALLRGNVEGGAVGFFSGLLLDMLFGGVLGFYALLGLYLGIAAGSINRRLFRENLLVVLFFTFVYSVVYESVVYILNTIMSGDMKLLYPLTGVILPEAVYNCAAAVLIYALLIRADRRFSETGKIARKY
jgi:rod shape-determining protein MreD